jgi:hypothetical protein
VDYGYLSSQEDHGTLTLASDGNSRAPRTDSNSKWLRQSLREKIHPSSRTVADRSQHDNPLRHTPSLTLTLRPSLDRMIGGGSRKGIKRERGACIQHHAAAAPATVSGEPAT